MTGARRAERDRVGLLVTLGCRRDHAGNRAVAHGFMHGAPVFGDDRAQERR